MPKLTVALAKGRLAEQAIELFERCGVDCGQVRDPGRKLVLSDPTGDYSFILVKPSDVPTYVDHGVADMGVAGRDTLMEANRPLYEMLDLGFGRCRMCVAGDADRQPSLLPSSRLRVATKYPNIAKEFYDAKGQSIEVIKLNGSVELGPLVGLSDVIVDIVESGGTLRANGLSVLEEICPISAQLVVNQVSLKTKAPIIRPLLAQFKQILEERSRADA